MAEQKWTKIGDVVGAVSPLPEDPWMQGAMDTSGGPVSNQYFPRQNFLYFETAVKPELMVKKLREFNTNVDDELRLEDTSLEQLPSLTTSSLPDPGLITSLMTVLRWSDQNTFPALDILRSALLNISAQPLLTGA